MTVAGLLARANEALAQSDTAVPGEKLNIKLTTPEDWRLAQSLHDRLA